MFKISDALSKQKQNFLNEKSNRENFFSNELEDGNQNTTINQKATNNSKTTFEVDKDKTSNNNNSKNHEEVKKTIVTNIYRLQKEYSHPHCRKNLVLKNKLILSIVIINKYP